MHLVSGKVLRRINLFLALIWHENTLSLLEFSRARNNLIIRIDALLDNCVGVVLLVVLNLLDSFCLTYDFLIFASLDYCFSSDSSCHFGRWLWFISMKLVLFHRAVVAQFPGRNRLINLLRWHELCSLRIGPGQASGTLQTDLSRACEWVVGPLNFKCALNRRARHLFNLSQIYVILPRWSRKYETLVIWFHYISEVQGALDGGETSFERLNSSQTLVEGDRSVQFVTLGLLDVSLPLAVLVDQPRRLINYLCQSILRRWRFKLVLLEFVLSCGYRMMVTNSSIRRRRLGIRFCWDTLRLRLNLRRYGNLVHSRPYMFLFKRGPRHFRILVLRPLTPELALNIHACALLLLLEILVGDRHHLFGPLLWAELIQLLVVEFLIYQSHAMALRYIVKRLSAGRVKSYFLRLV